MCTIWCNGLCDGGCGEHKEQKFDARMEIRVWNFDFQDGQLKIKEEVKED